MSQRPFIHDDIFLSNAEARRLYHEHAAHQPIIDYHCHLPPDKVAKNHRFADLTELWLGGDHYKWRALRSNGVSEDEITGGADSFTKFQRWAETMPRCLRNPLYHWSHLELARAFGVTDRLLDPATARSIWDDCNAQLATEPFRAQGIMSAFRVELVCTTDDPVDDLEHHRAHAASGSPIRMLPTWRPDRALGADQPTTWNAWLDRLSELTGIEIREWDQLLAALRQRHGYFHELGCRLSDHGLEVPYAADYTDSQVRSIFRNARAGVSPGDEDLDKLRSALMHEFGLMDHERGWTKQLHIGALRNNNSRLLRRLGADAGVDSIADGAIARPLSRYLDRLDSLDRLPKVILYNLNPRDNELMATMIGNFQDGSIPGKLQYGSAWWFLDQWDGMTKQIEALSQLGLLSRFVGMLTDSRSFVSYVRHEYFRRLLCDLLGRDMADGRIPRDFRLVGGMVEDISYRNAKGYFGF